MRWNSPSGGSAIITEGSAIIQVTVLGRAYNYLLSALRIYVEHHFARLQTYGILRDRYRGRFERHEDVFCIVSGLLNFRAPGSLHLG